MDADEITTAMSDENVQRIESRFMVGETVEFFYAKKWRPVTIVSVNNLIVNQWIKKYPSETFKSAIDGGFHFFTEVRYKSRSFSVLQSSKRLAFTNTHIREGDDYYDRMVKMMGKEPERVQKMRHTRETRLLTGVYAFDTGLARIRPLGCTLSGRAHFSLFVSSKTINNKNIKPSGPPRLKKRKKEH